MPPEYRRKELYWVHKTDLYLEPVRYNQWRMHNFYGMFYFQTCNTAESYPSMKNTGIITVHDVYDVTRNKQGGKDLILNPWFKVYSDDTVDNE